MWLALCLVGLGVVVLITSTAIGVADPRTASLSAAVLCTAGMGATLWSFARSGPSQVERPANGAILPVTVAPWSTIGCDPFDPFIDASRARAPTRFFDSAWEPLP